MVLTHKQHPPSWIVACPFLTEMLSLSSACTSSRYTSFRRRPRGFRCRRLLALVPLFLSVRDLGQELLDCNSQQGITSCVNVIHFVAAASVLSRVAERSADNDALHQSLGAARPVSRKGTTVPSSSLELPPDPSVSEQRLSWLASEDEKLRMTSVTRERRLFTMHSKPYRVTESEPLVNPMWRGYSAGTRDELMALAESPAPGMTGGANKPYSTLPDTTASGDIPMSSPRSNITDSTSYGSVLYGRNMYEAIYYRLLERLGNLTAFSNEVRETTRETTEKRPHQQFLPTEFRAPWRREEAEQPSRGVVHSAVLLLPKKVLMHASVLPDVVSEDTIAEKPTPEKGGRAAEQEHSRVPHGLLLGIISCFIGAFCGSLGDNMVRRSFMLLQEKEQRTFLHMWRSPLWTTGMFLTIVVNTCCSVVGLAFAPATVVTSFAGVHIFWNTLLAKTLNREKATTYDYGGTVAVILGIVLIVVFSGGNQAIQSYQAFADNLYNPGPVMYILFVIMLLAFASALECSPYMLLRCQIVSASAAEEWGARARLAERFLLAATSGACGGLSNLFAKATILLLNSPSYPGSDHRSAKQDMASAPALRQGYLHLGCGPFLLVTLTGAVAGAQLLFLNASLRKFEAIYVVPTINSVLIVMGALGGIVLFREVPAQYTLFALGLISVVTGVTALSYGKYEAEQHVLRGGQRKGTALRNIAGREPGDPLLHRASHGEASFGELQQEEPYVGGISTARGWFETLFRPLRDASINILVRTNTLNTDYPAGLLNIAHLDSNANIRILHQASQDLSGVNEVNVLATSAQDPLTPAAPREQDKRVVRAEESLEAGEGESSCPRNSRPCWKVQDA